MDRWLVVTSVGTSALTNYARLHAPQFLDVLRKTANATAQSIDEGHARSIDSLKEAAASSLAGTDPRAKYQASAELNALYKLYGQRIQDRQRLAQDQHFLVTSGTFQGLSAADLLREHLVGLGLTNTTVVSFDTLTTATQSGFSEGIERLVEWFASTLPAFRAGGYHICFNLVGGFKSVQGYLNTLGMFYADEIIYIFEGENNELLRLPRLPVRLDELGVLISETAPFALMWHGHLLPWRRAAKIPEALLERDGEVCTLSGWGQVVWERNRDAVLGQSGLLDLPKLQYLPSFRDDFARIRDAGRRAHVIDSTAKVAALWLDGGLARLMGDGGLNVKLWTDGGGERIHRFRVDQDWRASFGIERSQLLMRHVGNHEYMDRNV